ncbi:glycosyltransferase family 39 protein [Streptomyces sp. SAS_270]|uniref:glycosyltransferase family 39 protein n=1 Tax=Streptomyces sp. SAS_270 TaxID=3412748 RepID=UPI00403D2FA1
MGITRARRSDVTLPEATAAPAAASAAARLPSLVAVCVPVLVMLGVGLWGLDRGGMWRDEAVTFQVARRSVPQIWHLLHNVDAVHGLYYLLMHAALAPHPSEIALRLPSVCGAAATAGFVAALGVRLGRPRVGLWAGLLYAVTPLGGYYAQEGRSYALVAAGAVGATLLLVETLRSPRPARWGAYAGAVAVTCLLHELAVVLLLAHAATLATARVPWRVWRGWACAAGAALLALLPLALVSHAQSAQVAWLAVPGAGSAEHLLREFTGPAEPVVVPYLVLIAVALRPSRERRPGTPSLAAVALPLMMLPPAALFAVSRVVPLYDERYVLYALAGAPLLAAAGADRLAGAAARLWKACGPRDAERSPGRLAAPLAPAVGVLAVALVLAWQLPLLREDRAPEGRPDNLAALPAVAARTLRPGEPVLFLPSIGRRSALAYPEAFRGVRDVALAVPAAQSGTLYGVEAGPRELRRRLARLDHVWVVTERFALRPAWYPRDPAERVKLAVVDEEFVPREEIARRGATLRLFVRRPPTDSLGPELP